MKGVNLQRSFANEHWNEAEPKSDSQIGRLMNVGELKHNVMDKLKKSILPWEMVLHV